MTRWKYDPKWMSLSLDGYYEVDLERCSTSAQVLDWIIQISKKPWCSDEILADLVRQLDRHLDLQEHVCSWGCDHRLNVKRWLSSQKAKDRIYLTREVVSRYLPKGKMTISICDYDKAVQAALADRDRNII